MSYAAYGGASAESTPPGSTSTPTYDTALAELDRVEPLSPAYAVPPDVEGSEAELRDAIGARPTKSAKGKAGVQAATQAAPHQSSFGSSAGTHAYGHTASTGAGDAGRDDGDNGDNADDADGADDGDDGNNGGDDGRGGRGGRPRSRKTIIVSALSLVVGLGIAALVFLGRANSASFYISCEPDRIVAQQGRSFPPWGESTLDGKQWAAIKIPPEAECIPLETESEIDLSDQFRALLVKRATVLLTAKEVTKTDDASALLEQALLHARSSADSARNARVEIQRLLGDVVYWRASLKMRDASKALVEAAKQFDDAARQRPRHVSDAGAWADYLRKVVGELEVGPAGSPQTVFPPTPQTSPSPDGRTPAPPGVALPIEPGQGSASEPAPVPPDAGVPTGGVLL